VEWVTRQVPLFGGASFLLRRIVQCVDPLKGGDDIWEKRLDIGPGSKLGNKTLTLPDCRY